MNNLLKEVAREEGVDYRVLVESFERGRVAICKPPRSGKTLAVGENLKVKVNANLGTSGDVHDEDFELA